jgi:hypothetical protein
VKLKVPGVENVTGERPNVGELVGCSVGRVG